MAVSQEEQQLAQLRSTLARVCMEPSQMMNGINEVETLELKDLCLYDIVKKLRNPGQYDIGGCFRESLDLWFFYTTSKCPGDNYLLNLFVNNIKPSFVFLNISSSKNIVATDNGCSLIEKFENIYIIKNEGNHHLRTYRFTDRDIIFMEATGSLLHVPIKINVCTDQELSEQSIHPIIKTKIKLDHNFVHVSKTIKFDYALITKDKKRIDVHKMVLLAHSPVFKDMINKTSGDFLVMDIINIYLKVIVEFLYTGVLERKQPKIFCFNKLIAMADQLQIYTLSSYSKVLLDMGLNYHVRSSL